MLVSLNLQTQVHLPPEDCILTPAIVIAPFSLEFRDYEKFLIALFNL